MATSPTLNRIAGQVDTRRAEMLAASDAYWDTYAPGPRPPGTGAWSAVNAGLVAAPTEHDLDEAARRDLVADRRYRHAIGARRMIAAALDRLHAQDDRRRAYRPPTIAALRRARRCDAGPPGHRVAAAPCRPTGPPARRAGAAT